MNYIKLGVNIDHIATLRQARGGIEPEPIAAAAIAELNGADGITIHLREDRRHIQDRDLILLRQTAQTSLNLEMANTAEIIKIALNVKPNQITLVPERRQELTTEGGLDVIKNFKSLKNTITKFQKKYIDVSLFIEANKDQIKYSKECGATHIELHTGSYANAKTKTAQKKELQKLLEAAEYADSIGLIVNAGHGLNYINVTPLLVFDKWNEFNIGHSIISRAVFVGLANAVREMKTIINSNLQMKIR
ncbi:MAG TPA: pyridoxine 5'-phosphate synthase [bacterium]|nr:pyridoxine 5'-phosphate synthase [bacterium]